MRGKPLNLPEPSPEEVQAQSDLLSLVWREHRQDEAQRARQEQPLASLILREMLLDKIKPNGWQKR
jgi:hypothetical protein